MCGDITKVTQMSFEDNVKVLEISKHDVTFYLCEEDVLALIDANFKLIKHEMRILEGLNFHTFYYNIINIINSMPNAPVLKLELIELLYGSCRDGNVLLLKALREYMYFYKDNVLHDIQ